MPRIRTDFVAGALDAALAAGATSMSSPALADLAAVASPDVAAVSLYTADSNGRITKKEIVHVTAHTAAATTATITRGREGTSDQAWSSGDKWEHAATKEDFGGEWTVYTPTWTGTGSNPAIGNGTLTGRYCQVGKLVTAVIRVVMGSTTTFGSGDYRWGLPVTGRANEGAGAVHALDSGTARRTGTTVNEGTAVFVAIHGSGLIWGASQPHVWAVNDQIDMTVTYEAA